jgi:HEAT repeat protein
VEPLIAALKDVDRDVRYTAIKTAIKALSQIGDPLAGEPLIAALKDGDRYVRYATAEALGAIGDARVVEPLITSLSANDPDTRRTVAQAQVRLYQKPDLSQTCRQQIFAVRKSITDIHDDQPHIDESRDCFSNRPHADRNLDVEFLL